MTHQFHKIAGQYFNYGYLNRIDKVLSLCHNSYPFSKNAKLIAYLWSNKYQIKLTGKNEHTVNITKYIGTNSSVNAISSFLSEYLNDYIYGAIVHGSIATDEAINYSDFDGLIILKDSIFEDPSKIKKAGLLLNQAYALMLHFDPLQHHGWFITTESDLSNWPVSYFPPIIFDYSKSLLHKNLNISLRYTDNKQSAILALKNNASRLIQNLNNNKPPLDAFSLKSLLSEFMLLPTLYESAKTGKGVHKKFSFELAKADFSADDWKIMDEVSLIRATWPIISNRPCTQNSGKVNILTRKCQKKILIDSTKVKVILNKEFRLRMIRFAELIQSKIL